MKKIKLKLKKKPKKPKGDKHVMFINDEILKKK
jgi:hypothetical protein